MTWPRFFDYVNHEILLVKLHFKALKKQVHTGLHPIYQTEKNTEIKSSNNAPNFFSNWEPIKCGVPHGTILDLF
jgi:hypothetical protein